MFGKFKKKYRIPSNRLNNWNYGWNAAYFVTLCTQNRKLFFGEIVDGEMQLSKIGEIVEKEWVKTFQMRTDMNLQMDEYVVMPNHFHAIIIIGKNNYNTRCWEKRADELDSGGNAMENGCRDAMHSVSTEPTKLGCKNQFGPQSKNLASIIRGFKTGVTINARKIHADFAWQSRYYDHIIRNDESFRRIKKYIGENPLKWGNDKFYK